MMIRLDIVAVALVAVLAAGHASSAMYTGTLSTADGTLTGTDEWATGSTTLTYTVDDQTTPGFWHYAYTLTIPTDTTYAANIQHLVIGLSSGLTAGDLVNVNGQLHKVELVEAKGENANMPQDLYAVVFQVGGGESFVMVSFDTIYAPVWGDFFARGNNQNTIWNAGFTASSVDPTVPPSVYQADFILRPDPIPEPTTMLILSLAGACALRRRRRMA